VHPCRGQQYSLRSSSLFRGEISPSESLQDVLLGKGYKNTGRRLKGLLWAWEGLFIGLDEGVIQVSNVLD
jgi:hypothetical protein